MSSRPTSRAAAGEESTTSLRSSTAKRPLTKPVAPRLATSSTATKSTSTSSTRASTTPSSSLNKPPTRPTTTTASTVRRPPSSAATTTSSLHRARPSNASVEVSGDEAKRDGIKAQPKRMSLASTTSTDKPTTVSSRMTSATPARKPSSSTTASSVRPSVRSPTSTTKTAVSSTTRPSSTLSSRTRPLSTSVSNTAPGIVERKRLSTIPASPAVRTNKGIRDENKENEGLSESESRFIRPALGERQSTRSTLIEKRIEEFELVNQMLRSAMITDGITTDEEAQIEEESKNTLAKLRGDLAKLKSFEKQHGRLPTEEELAEVDDMSIADENVKESDDEGELAAKSEVVRLRGELEASQNQVEGLKSHLIEMNARMEYFSRSAEEEGNKVQDATENIRSEHEHKIEEILALHKSQIEDLENSHLLQLEEAAQKYSTEVESLKKQHYEASSSREVEVVALKAELEVAKNAADGADSSETLQGAATTENSELEEMKRQLKATKDRHLAAKDNAKSKMAKVLEDYAKGIAELKEKHAERITEMQKQIDEAQGKSPAAHEGLVREEAHAQTLQQMQSMRDELDELKKSRDSDDKAHAQSLQELKQQLVAVEDSKTQAVEGLQQSIDKLKHGHDAQLQELKEAHERWNQQTSENMERLEDELKTSQNLLAETESSHKKSKQELEAQLRTAASAAETATTAHQSEVGALHAKLDSMNQSSEGKAMEHSQKIEELTMKLESKEEELEALKHTVEADIAKVRSDAEADRQSAIESLQARHAAKISQLEEQSTSALQDLEGVESANSANIDRIKKEAAAEKRKVLDEQAASHTSAMTDVETRLASLQAEMQSLKDAHEQEVESLKSDHASDKQKALVALADEHNGKLAELSTQSKASDDALGSVKASHADEIQKLESKAKSASDELDAARFQVKSLKDILQSMEKENEQKDEEHQNELEKKDVDFSQAVGKLSAQSMRIAELETAHRQAVEQAKAAVEAETQASLDALKQEHDEAFDVLRRSLEQAHLDKLRTMHSEHSSAIDLLTKEVDTRDHDIEKLKDEHARALMELRNSSEQGSITALEQMKTEHSAALQELKSGLETQHAADMKNLQNEHTSKIAEASQQQVETSERTKRKHEEAIAILQSDLDQTLEKLRDTTALDGLNAKLVASEQALSKLQEEQAAKTSSQSEEHTKEVGKLRDEIESLKREARRPADTTELDATKVELAETKAKIAALTSSHADAIGNKDLEHADAMRKLQSELDEATATASRAGDNARDLEEVKSLLTDAKHTVAELSEQYALATMEAENQRVAAESAKKELADLKKSLSEASTQLQPASSPDSKKATAKSVDRTPTEVKSSPKPGLMASKWATADPETENETEPPISEPSTSVTENQEEGSNRQSGAAGRKGSKSKPKRNIAGQVAGIQEHIRQLSEMNDEFLQDHQKWARTLSRVEEDGTVTVTDAPEGVNAGDQSK